MLACSSPPPALTAPDPDEADVQDILSLVKRSDGDFDIVCSNGTREVRSAADIKAGNVCVVTQTTGLTCVSRDNDGQNPFVLARFTPEGQLVPVAGAVYGTLGDCRTAAGATRAAGAATLVCASRDNDGQNPWTLGLVDAEGQATHLGEFVFGTLTDCLSALQSGVTLAGELTLCTSRDGDGQNPFVPVAIDAAGARTRLAVLVYGAFDQCRVSLVAARSLTGDAALVCAPRDSDGQNPWSLFRVAGGTATSTGQVFDSQQSCTTAITG
jgi:hypothetical protein